MKPHGRTLINTAGLVLISFAGFAFLHHRRYMEAYSAAAHAFRGAWEYKDSEALLYEPRRYELEAANAKLAQVWAFGTGEQLRTLELQTCAIELEIYRTAGESIEDARESGVFPASSLNEQIRIKRAVIPCLISD